jgi:cytochrome oxidase assembly protein ShyY1
MQPQQHLGYAVQWFGLALALAAWLFWYGWLRRHSRGDEVRG